MCLNSFSDFHLELFLIFIKDFLNVLILVILFDNLHSLVFFALLNHFSWSVRSEKVYKDSLKDRENASHR
jgi:hypothetical protein